MRLYLNFGLLVIIFYYTVYRAISQCHLWDSEKFSFTGPISRAWCIGFIESREKGFQMLVG